MEIVCSWTEKCSVDLCGLAAPQEVVAHGDVGVKDRETNDRVWSSHGFPNNGLF